MTVYCTCGCSEHMHRMEPYTRCDNWILCGCVGWAARGVQSVARGGGQ